MLRPRRAASQKAKQKPGANDSNRDEDLGLSEESSGDFSSASSDEYDPGKEKDVEETFEESDEAVSEEEEEEDSSFAEQPSRKSKSKRVSFVSTLRGSTSSKFKRNQTNGSKNIQDILQRSQFQKKKGILDDSNTKEKTPEFDCSGGLRLSDSSGNESDGGPTTSAKAIQHDKKKSSKLIDSINHASGSTMVDLKKNHDNLQLIEEAKANMLKYKSNQQPADHQKENFNIAELLLMGEDVPAEQPKSQKKSASQKRARNDSESDDGWEEVEDEVYKVPSQGVEILLNNQPEMQLKNVKKVDLDAQLKRKLNRQRKEYQLRLHKTSLLSWVEHCAFVNRKLNDTNLMAEALKLLPKNKNYCYPTDQTDLDYFRQITKWFKSTIALRNPEMYCGFKPLPPIMMSLALQMKFKAAICRRDYVLIFVILLRAIGVQCRMVQSLVLAPILPPKSELISLSAKPSATANTKSSAKKPAKSKASGSKSKNLAIPQLDGGDDRPSRARRPIKIKGASGNGDRESFIDINKDDTVVDEAKGSKQTRNKSKASNNPGTAMSPKVRFAMDSPNRDATSPSAKLFRSSLKNKQTAKGPVNSLKENASNFSPLKTRAMRNAKENSPAATSSKAAKAPAKPNIKALKVQTEKPATTSKSPDQPKSSAKVPVVKDTLKVFSPRRLRSRSRSSNDEKVSPNPKSGAESRKRAASDKAEVVETKKPKASPRSAGEKRRNADKEDEVQKKKAKANDEKKEVQNSDKKAAKSVSKQESESDYEGDTDESEKLFKKKVLPLKKPLKKNSKLQTLAMKGIDRRVLSTDSEADSAPRKSKGIDIWVELYSEKDKKWIPIDLFNGKVDCVKDVIKAATHPMVYVFAFNNDNSLKDVSARYCPNLCTTVRKMRVDNKYLESVIGRYQGIKTARDLKEDEELNSLLIEKPMPTSVAQFKNHPLFALKRHLLKYEAIYPPEPPILGYIRDEAIYPREAVFVLHTRETWLKEARVVKLNEKPYKMSKTLKWDNVNRKILKDIPQELYGIWQTKDFEPPVAENGMVPRNAYGNVELFKPCMLPKGCVHLQLPGLNKVCKKIGVDCSQAIVGFDANSGWPYPVYDGFIVCEEFEEKVIDAWNREQEELERKEIEKVEKRVYGNWKKLIKGLLIRQRLKNKYNFEGTQ